MNFDVDIDGRVRRYIRSLWKDDDLASFLRKIGSHGDAYLFGGALRDVVFAEKSLVNDLDIFVSGDLERAILCSEIGGVRRTNFGGYRLTVGRFDVDIWDLTRSFAFRFDASSFINVDNLLGTVCFSTDGIAASFTSGSVRKSSSFIRALETRRLDFIVPPYQEEILIATRIARLAVKLRLELTPSVADYFVKCYERFGPEALVGAESRWGANRILNSISIEQVMAEMRASIDASFRILSAGESESTRSLASRRRRN